MKQSLTYGVLCEDKAHKNFIEHYLTRCYADVFQMSEPFGWSIKATNAREVDDAISDATRLGFTRFSLDVLFVGRDADTTNPEQIENLKRTLTKLCHNHPRVIFMVPVQCIEHWLLYIQWHRNNPASTKNESLEHVTRNEAKARIYGGKLRVEKQIEMTSQLLINFDTDWLESRSESFRFFHQGVKSFVGKLQ